MGCLIQATIKQRWQSLMLGRWKKGERTAVIVSKKKIT